MKPVIEIHQLGKKYQIEKKERYLSLRDSLTYKRNTKKRDFWALKDINLTIERGERIGIIGKNGAGKSTFLKILSRITWPTCGEAIIRGRLASLLEVGTGFHPELTGRENIYLNGSILGLKKSEINRKLDEIVDFSEIEDFLDTTLKKYSSGMQLRLAFAVAAHLEPQVLILDEVLAVGDIDFQKKCLKKMEEISISKERTILFVSHNLKMISDFCSKTVWMESGKVKQVDDTDSVIFNYINSSNVPSTGMLRNEDESGTPIFINDVKPVDERLEGQSIFILGEKIGVIIEIKNRLWRKKFTLGLGLNTVKTGRILKYSIDFSPMEIGGSRKIMIWLPFEELTPGIFTFDLSITSEGAEAIDLLTNVGSFEIPIENTHYEQLKYDYGVFRKNLAWHEIS